MPKHAQKVRILGLPSNYIYKDWLHQALQDESSPLDYFSFADKFDGSEWDTNLHYGDLLARLEHKNQSKKLIHLVSVAAATFKKRKKGNTEPGFPTEYHNYWTRRRNKDAAAIIAARQTVTVTTLNELSCQGIERLAKELDGRAGESSSNTYSNSSKNIHSGSSNIQSDNSKIQSDNGSNNHSDSSGNIHSDNISNIHSDSSSDTYGNSSSNIHGDINSNTNDIIQRDSSSNTHEDNSRNILSSSSSNIESGSDTSNVLPQLSNSQQMLKEIVQFSAGLSSDRVGCLGIVDISSIAVVTMLEEHLDRENYEEILERSTLPTIELSTYAQELLDAVTESKLASISIRVALYQAGFKLSFNLILNHDAGFIETTIRHFLDLMDSPNNPLVQASGERTACINTIIYVINQLFISNNDLVALDWIEHEYCKTGRSKWDGIILKINDRKTSPVLVEFSGGLKVNATMNKEASDLIKLYSNMTKIIDTLQDDVPKTMFCARFYDEIIYFEELFAVKDTYFRKIHVSFRCPTTPRLLVHFASQIPQMLRWKEAVLNQTLQFQE